MIESLFVFACRRCSLPAAWHLCLVLCSLRGWADLCRAYHLVVYLNSGAEYGRNQHRVWPKCLFDNIWGGVGEDGGNLFPGGPAQSDAHVKVAGLQLVIGAQGEFSKVVCGFVMGGFIAGYDLVGFWVDDYAVCGFVADEPHAAAGAFDGAQQLIL